MGTEPTIVPVRRQGVPTTTGLFGESVSAAVAPVTRKIVVVTLPSKVMVTAAAAGSALRSRNMAKDIRAREFIYFREIRFNNLLKFEPPAD
jgi:hypothetical protein